MGQGSDMYESSCDCDGLRQIRGKNGTDRAKMKQIYMGQRSKAQGTGIDINKIGEYNKKEERTVLHKSDPKPDLPRYRPVAAGQPVVESA
jgi:hypothetical protein